MCQSTVISFLECDKLFRSPIEFAAASLRNVNVAASKSSLQSDIGALSRRSKLGVQSVFISESGCFSFMSTSPVVQRPLFRYLNCKHVLGLFGDPCIWTRLAHLESKH